MNMYCIYHKDCLDGFAAALAVHVHYKQYPIHGVDVVFIPATYGDPFPTVEKDSTVYIVDFSYPADILIKMSQHCKLTVIDHHISAIRDIANAFDLNSHFYKCDITDREEFIFKGSVTHESQHLNLILDTNQSGATLTYDHLWEDHSIATAEWMAPRHLFRWVGDRDLWKFYYKETKPFCRYLTTLGWDFGKWTEVLYQHPQGIINTGELLLKDDELKIQWHLDNAMEVRDLSSWWGVYDLEGTGIVSPDQLKEIPVVNVPKYLVSDTLNSLVDKYPFVIGYHCGDGERVYRLNSSKKGSVDVSRLAKLFGGGGHVNAAGIKIKSKTLRDDLINHD